MTDFSVPQRMSPGALVIIFLKISKSAINIFWILILSYLIKADFDFADGAATRMLEVAGGCILFAVGVALATFLSQKFYIRDGNLIFKHGVIKREVTTIPLARIHTLRTKKGVFYRILGLRGIAVDTLASKHEEIELILDEQDWHSLLHYIERGESRWREEGPSPGHAMTATKRFSNSNLLLDALCQNHFKGAAIMLGFLAMIYDKVMDIDSHVIDKVTDYATGYFESSAITPLEVVMALGAVYVGALIFWVGKVMLRYYDLTLSYDSRLLTFSHGALARMSSRFAYGKICTVWVKRNILEHHFGLSTVMLRQALNATADKEEDNLKIYGDREPEFFLRWWLGEDYASSPEVMTARSGRGALMRVLIPDLMLVVAVTVLLCYYRQFVWLLLPAVYLPVSVVKAICAMRRSRITLRDNHIEVSNGRLAEMINYIKYENVEVVDVRCTPATPFFDRVTLTLATPGSSFRIRSLRRQEAEAIREYLLFRSTLL